MTIADLINQRIPANSEKRRHHRISLCLPVEYSFPESPCPRFAHTVNICEEGLLMYAPRKLEIGQNLRAKVYYDSASGIDCIEALGEVIRVDRLGKSGKEYRCAVRFIDLPADILKKLRKFLKGLN